MLGDDKKGVQPWMLFEKGPMRDLVFAYESVLTEMRSLATTDLTIRSWVQRIDYERDTFVRVLQEIE